MVTGASRGLGEFFAKVLAAEGAHVALAARSQPALKNFAEQIAAAGGKAYPLELDVRRADMVERVFADIAARCGAPTSAGAAKSLRRCAR